VAVLGRILLSSSQRIDLADFLSIDAYAAGDWKYFLQTLVGDTGTYVIKGFDVINATSAINQSSLSIRAADSAVYYPESSAGPFFYGLPEGTPGAEPLIPVLVANATNYIYLTLSTTNTAEDSRAFWDPDANGGSGSEYSAPVNTEEAITATINVSTGSFPQGTVPIAIVVCSSNGDLPQIDEITDARSMMFRLGSGGISPNPFNTYSWPDLPSLASARNEPPITATLGSTETPFEGGDKNIASLKEWMDAVMSRIRELGGTQYWYTDSSTMSLMSLFVDALATAVKSKGTWEYSIASPGVLTWSEDVIIKSTQDSRDYILRAGNTGSTLLNEHVLYIAMDRGYQFNSANQGVQWTSGSTLVSAPGGALGLFANLKLGDYVKKTTDSNDKFLRVEEFYVNFAGTGTVSSPANAGSIRLSSNYAGSNGIAAGTADQGIYATASVASRGDAAIAALGGDFHWLAVRSDTILNIASIVPATTSGTVLSATGSVVTVSATAHGLSDKDFITVTAPASIPQVQIDRIDANTFSFSSTSTATGAFTAHSAVVTTAARQNSPYNSYVLENADNNFANGDVVDIAGASIAGYNAKYQNINSRSATSFNIPIPSALGTPTVSSATATAARVIVRTENGNSTLAQGMVIDITDTFASNVMSFLGMTSSAQTSPQYSLPSSYNTLFGQSSFNSSTTDDVTARLSKLTAMMADRAQDKNIHPLPVGLVTIDNTTNGAAQEITFTSGSTLVLNQPGSGGNATITLPSSAPGISLLGNQSAYVEIDRNASKSISGIGTGSNNIVITNTTDVPVGENIFVIASRITGSDIYLWDGNRYGAGQTSPFDPLMDRNTALEDGGIMSYSVSTGVGTLTFTQNLNLVLNSTSGGTPTTINLGSSSRTFTNNGDMWYVIINRATGAVVTNTVVTAATGLPTIQANQQVFLIAKRSDSADSNLVSYGMASRLYFRNGFTMVQGQISPMGNDKTFISPVNFVPTNVSGAGTFDLTSQATPFIRFTAAPTSLRRIAAGSSGQFLIIKNASASSFTVTNAAGAGTGAQIITGTGVDLTLSSNASISLIYDATSATWNIVGGTGSGVGSNFPYNDDLITTLFRAKITDTFTEPASATASTIDGTANVTNATFLASAPMYQLQYDASKTIAAGTTTTNIVLNSAITSGYTAAVGDMVIVGTGTVAPIARRITAVVTPNTVFTVEAFPTAPTVSAQVTVSQAVVTKNLYTSNFDGDSLSVTYSAAAFQEILVDYEDSTGATNTTFDIASAPVIGWSASNDLGTNWSTVGVRPTLQTTTANSSFLAASSSSGLNVRFFANRTSGDGTASPINLLTYRTYLLKDSTSSYGSQNSAIGFTDSPTTSSVSVNCTITTVGGKTRITLNFQYAVGVSSGSPYGALDVYLNGQILPRFINSTVTPDASYTEVNANVIDLDQNYGTVNLAVEVIQRVTVTDTNTQNTTNIASLQANANARNYVINGALDFWQAVGSSTSTVNTATATTTFAADMFNAYSQGTTVKNYSVARNTASLPTFAQSGFNSQYSYLFTMLTGIATFTAANDYVSPFSARFEYSNIRQILGKTVTFGFWTRASVTGTYSFALTDNPLVGLYNYVTTFTINAANTWEFKSITLTLPNIPQPLSSENVSGLEIYIGVCGNAASYSTSVLNTWTTPTVTPFYFSNTSVNWMATTNATLYIAQLSLTEGAFGLGATGFRRNQATIGAELQACQRYYEKSYDLDVVPGTSTSNNQVMLIASVSRAAGLGGGRSSSMYAYKVNKRGFPTVTLYSQTGASGNVLDTSTNANVAATIDPTNNAIGFGANASGAAPGAALYLHFVADSRL
jgi:hypothetical protein